MTQDDPKKILEKQREEQEQQKQEKSYDYAEGDGCAESYQPTVNELDDDTPPDDD